MTDYYESGSIIPIESFSGLETSSSTLLMSQQQHRQLIDHVDQEMMIMMSHHADTGVRIDFQHIYSTATVAGKGKIKVILNDISGHVNPGRLTALMGVGSLFFRNQMITLRTITNMLTAIGFGKDKLIECSSRKNTESSR